MPALQQTLLSLLSEIVDFDQLAEDVLDIPLTPGPGGRTVRDIPQTASELISEIAVPFGQGRISGVLGRAGELQQMGPNLLTGQGPLIPLPNVKQVGESFGFDTEHPLFTMGDIVSPDFLAKGAVSAAPFIAGSMRALTGFRKGAGMAGKLQLRSPSGTPFEILVNPTPQEARRFFGKGGVRASKYGDDVVLWDATAATHRMVENQIGVGDDFEVFSGRELRDQAEAIVKGDFRQGTTGRQREIPVDLEDIVGPVRPTLPDMPRVDYPPLEVPTAGRRVTQTTGKIVGAPPGIDTHAHEAASVERYLRYAEIGAPGVRWYTDQSQLLFDLMGRRAGLADRLAGAVGVTSAQNTLQGNFRQAITGFNQAMAGNIVRVSSQLKNEKVGRIVKEGVIDRLGEKVSPFTLHLRQAFTRGGEQVFRAVHDVWDAGAWGFPKGFKLGSPNHRWMDIMTDDAIKLANERKLGGVDNWNHDSIQAAVWIARKSQEENIPLEDLLSGYRPLIAENTVGLMVERIPKGSLFEDLPAEQKLAETLRRESSVTTERGGDIIAQLVGLPTPTPAARLPGKVIGPGDDPGGVPNPVTRIPVLGGRIGETKDLSAMRLEPSTQEMINATAASHGLLFGQADIATVTHIPVRRLMDSNTFSLEMPFFPVEEDVVRLKSAFSKQGVDAIILPTPGGNVQVVSLNATGKDLKAAAEAVRAEQGLQYLDRAGKPTDEFQKFANIGGLLTSEEGFKPSAWLALPGLKNPLIRERLRERLPVLAKAQMDAMGGGITKVHRKVLEAMSEGGLEKVEELVKTGAVPAVVIGLLVRETLLGEAPPDAIHLDRPGAPTL